MYRLFRSKGSEKRVIKISGGCRRFFRGKTSFWKPINTIGRWNETLFATKKRTSTSGKTSGTNDLFIDINVSVIRVYTCTTDNKNLRVQRIFDVLMEIQWCFALNVETTRERNILNQRRQTGALRTVCNHEWSSKFPYCLRTTTDEHNCVHLQILWDSRLILQLRKKLSRRRRKDNTKSRFNHRTERLFFYIHGLGTKQIFKILRSGGTVQKKIIFIQISRREFNQFLLSISC